MTTNDKPLLRALVQHFRGGRDRDLGSVLQALVEAHRAHPIDTTTPPARPIGTK
ncbi:MAG: hypothetical protein AB1698_01275 [Pseudomonadota bacterium]